MPQTLFVHASPHGHRALGYRLAREILAAETQRDGRPTPIERDLVATPLPPLTPGYAEALTSRGPAAETAGELEVSERLIRELERSDRLLIAMPMHNFSVPAAFKLWLDHVVRIDRSFVATPEGKVGLLADRPTTVLVSSGGFHRPEGAGQPDFLSPYLEHVLATIGIHDVDFVYLQGLVLGEDAVDRAWRDARDRLVQAGVLSS